MKKWTIAIVGILVVVVGVFMGVKKVSPLSWGMWGNYNTSAGLALQGYDAVAYIQDAKATPGDSDFSYDWVAGVGDGTLEASTANWQKR